MTSTALEQELEHPESAEVEASGQQWLGITVGGIYRITRLIGSGGSSHVFEAEHVLLGKNFAIKVLRAELDGKRAAQRFRREATAIARLQSEYIVSVIHCGELDHRTPYLVMELLDGEDLRRLLNRVAPLPARRAVQIAIEACHGLTEVHRAGLVHRDLKPENLFITRGATGEDWCKVLDFGVAKMESSLATAQGSIVGTIRYMAPEQLTDTTQVGPATDVYAIGAILYECLSGRPLIVGGSVQESMYSIINVAATALMGHGAPISRALGRIIEACLDKSPNKRPRSTAELATLLEDAMRCDADSMMLGSTVAETELPIAPLLTSRWRRLGWIMVGALATTLLGASLGWLMRAPPDTLPSTTLSRPEPSARLGVITSPGRVPNASPTRSVHLTTSPHAPSETLKPVQPAPRKRSAPSAAAGRASASPLSSAAARQLAAPRHIAVGRFDHTNPYGD